MEAAKAKIEISRPALKGVFLVSIQEFSCGGAVRSSVLIWVHGWKRKPEDGWAGGAFQPPDIPGMCIISNGSWDAGMIRNCVTTCIFATQAGE
jgi:hypothetical protein